MVSRSAGVLAACAALCGCAGAQYDIGADRARYPISFSPALPDEKGQILYLGHELESKGSFEVSKIQFGFLYSAIASSNLIDISDQVNEEVAKRGGEGVVALSVTTKNCFTNYLFPLQILPFYPGCQVSTISGTVVERKPNKAPDVAAMSRLDGRRRAQ